MFTVIVGNIGTVYVGESLEDAENIFMIYKEASESNFGRASGEDVTIFENEEIFRSHEGDIVD